MRRGAAGLQPISDLLVSDPADVAKQPFDILDANSFFKAPGMLAGVTKLYKSALDAFDEVRGLFLVPSCVPLLAAHHTTPFAHASAPIRDHIPPCGYPLVLILEDGGVGAASDIPDVLVVPV